MLNHASPIPLYQQLADLLRRAMDAGEYPEHQKIPSEHELAQAYGIGRPTVRQATDLLVREGVLERRRGSGTYVMPKAQHIDLLSLSGTGQALQASNVSASSEWLQLPELVVADAVKMGFDTAYQLQRITHIEGAPVLLETFYLNADVFVGFDQKFSSEQSLSEQVKQQYFYTATSADQHFNVMFPSRALADLMQVNNKMPLLHVARQLHFGLLQGAIYCDIVCRTDRFNFSQNINTNS
ncbi:MAG: GntR family transcriptional regulator [Gammaproteobacteria bacterium]|jgi:GntR family transcriptional regulator|nr:GntR family transcriptional regulator [Gammaproteobacteria bacterium]MCP4879299.1 GntR family transcriptional regulator [Gammaproteobacteria bacterium]MDP6166546.1 GntR family transcriptional regulator [Gammaproteobacteria bacterium]